eukprot:2189382-Pyramimonas_sp.AAC.1
MANTMTLTNIVSGTREEFGMLLTGQESLKAGQADIKSTQGFIPQTPTYTATTPQAQQVRNLDDSCHHDERTPTKYCGLTEVLRRPRGSPGTPAAHRGDPTTRP